MFCPVCRSEYRQGFTTCSDCHVDLVHRLPPAAEQDYVEFEEVLATYSPSDRAIITSILDAEGITYFFQGEHVSAYVLHAVPVRLLVAKDDVPRAVDLLRDLDLSFQMYGGHSPEDDRPAG